MEFSFDRSRESHARRADSPQTPTQSPAAQTATRPGPDLNTVDTSTIANDRLRKAIERNRAKQAGREAQRPAQSPQQAQPEPQQQGSFFSQSSQLSQEDQAHMAQQEALREAHRVANLEALRAREAQKQAEYAQYAQQAQAAADAERETQRQAQAQKEAAAQAAAQQEMPREIPVQAQPISREVPVEEAPQAAESPRARLRARMAGAAKMAEANEAAQAQAATTAPVKSTGMVSRRTVAKPEDTEFVPVKRQPKKVASQISYTTSSTRKKQKSMDPKYVTWLVKGSWIFCAIMVLRLIFANGGVTDFYSQKSTVNERVAELSDIKKENMQLVREIERMRSDAGFQKKLVRDNLGFIAADEFLVLFPK